MKLIFNTVFYTKNNFNFLKFNNLINFGITAQLEH